MKKYSLLTILFYVSFYVTSIQGQNTSATPSITEPTGLPVPSESSQTSSTPVASSTDIGTSTPDTSTSTSVVNTSSPVSSDTAVSTAMSLTSPLSSVVLNSTPQPQPAPTSNPSPSVNGNPPVNGGPTEGGVPGGGTSGIVVVTSTLGIAQPQPTDGNSTNGTDTTNGPGAASQREPKFLQLLSIASSVLVVTGLAI